MKKLTLILLVLTAALLIFGGLASVRPDSHRKITGGFYSKDFFDIQQGWFNFNIHEVDPISRDASGSSHWKEYKKSDGWRHVQAHPVCVAFAQYNGQPAATFVVQVDRITGWRDPAEFEGEYMKIWVVGGGTPGTEGDQWSSVGPWPPSDNLDDYGCDYEDPFFFQFPIDGGNLVIHPLSCRIGWSWAHLFRLVFFICVGR